MTDFCIFPIENHNLWEMYKKAQSCFWVAEEINLYEDIEDWKRLSDGERTFIKHVLAFFAQSDGIVNLNLTERFINEIPLKEAKFFYGFQIAMENIHNETYSLLIDTYIQDPREKQQLFSAIDNYPVVQRKAEWAMKWIGSGDSLAMRLIAFVIVEGVFFSGSFCAIFWIKQRGLMPGLTYSNELISRDEALHVEGGVLVYDTMCAQGLVERVPEEKVHGAIMDAVAIEEDFVRCALGIDLIGMNANLMTEYIHFVADRGLVQLGYAKLWHAKNPFPFMENISLRGKTNFFEKKNSDYMLPMDNAPLRFSADDDF